MAPVGDIVSSIIVICLIFLLVRWFSGKSSASTPRTPGIRGVTLSMVETVKSAFPDVPAPNIIYSLSRTRSAQRTSEEILERGFLPNPPPSFEIPYSLLPASTGTNAPNAQQKTNPATKPMQSLIDRYGLSTKLPSRKGKEREVSPVSGESDTTGETKSASTTAAGAAGKWEDSKEKREMGLKQRKEKMILEARKRLLEKQAQSEAGATGTS